MSVEKTKEIEENAKGAAYLQKALDSVDMVGMDTIAREQPTPEVMAAGLAHLLANMQLRPEYEAAVKSAMFQSVIQLKIMMSLPDELRKRIEAGASHMIGTTKFEAVDNQQEPIPATDHGIEKEGTWCERCKVRHDVTTKHAAMLAIARVQQDNCPPMVMMQLQETNEHSSAGLHCVFTSSEVKGIIEGLQRVLPSLEHKAH